jgi:hypothetical protein
LPLYSLFGCLKKKIHKRVCKTFEKKSLLLIVEGKCISSHLVNDLFELRDLLSLPSLKSWSLIYVSPTIAKVSSKIHCPYLPCATSSSFQMSSKNLHGEMSS